MTAPAPPNPTIRDTLASLAGVRRRRMFGADAYFAGSVLFAFLAEEGLVLRLPMDLREEVLRSGQGRTFLGPLPEGLSGWAVVSPESPAEPLILAAHQQARAMSRSAARRKRRAGKPRRAGRAGKGGD